MSAAAERTSGMFPREVKWVESLGRAVSRGMAVGGEGRRVREEREVIADGGRG